MDGEEIKEMVLGHEMFIFFFNFIFLWVSHHQRSINFVCFFLFHILVPHGHTTKKKKVAVNQDGEMKHKTKLIHDRPLVIDPKMKQIK